MTKILVEHYENCFTKHGDTAKGFDWPNEEGAMKRHQIMSELVKKTNSSLLDIGCGSMHFLEFLEKCDHPKQIHYHGLELSDKFAARCKEKYPDVPLYHLDILNDQDFEKLPQFDYVTLNGLLTLKAKMSQMEMTDFYQKILKRSWSRTRCGMAFNLMSKDIVDWTREDLFYQSFSEVSAFLKSELGTRHFVFRQDYGLYEFTTYVYREAQ